MIEVFMSITESYTAHGAEKEAVFYITSRLVTKDTLRTRQTLNPRNLVPPLHETTCSASHHV